MKYFLNILFYICLGALLFCLILPYTRFSHWDFFGSFASSDLNYNKKTMAVGDSFWLYIKGINRTAHYESSDFKVATVSQEGIVRAKRTGSTVVKVTKGESTYTCLVTVVEE